jgi:hypothetical protein
MVIYGTRTLQIMFCCPHTRSSPSAWVGALVVVVAEVLSLDWL